MKDANDRAMLKCSECGGFVRVIDGRPTCDCETAPEGYRFAMHEDMLEILGVDA